MDLESHRRWYDYSRTKDRMFKATDSEWAPWNVVDGDNKKRARLNCISHLLSQIPYERLEFDKPKLPSRQDSEGYKTTDYMRVGSGLMVLFLVILMAMLFLFY